MFLYIVLLGKYCILYCMISNSSFNPNLLCYSQRLASSIRTLWQFLTHQCHFQAMCVWWTCSLTFFLFSTWRLHSLISFFIPLVIMNSSNPIKIKRRKSWYLSFQTTFIFRMTFHTQASYGSWKKLRKHDETLKKPYPLLIPKYAPKGTENNYDVFLNVSLTVGRIGWMTYWMDMDAMLASLGSSNKWPQSVVLKQEKIRIS